MDHLEEQRNEIEALKEIYYNEIDVISDEPPICFSIEIRPQASCFNDLDQDVCDKSDDYDEDYDDDDDDDDDEDLETENLKVLSPCVKLNFKLPQKYPDQVPDIKILGSSNISDEYILELKEMLAKRAEESLGVIMTFTLVSEVVEWLSSMSDRAADDKEELIREQQRQEMEQARKFDGTPVTKQTFLAWKSKFDAEMLKQKLDEQKLGEQGSSNARRLTGREMFESDKTLAESDLNFVEDLDQSQLEALLQNVDLDYDENDFEGSDVEGSYGSGDSTESDDV